MLVMDFCRKSELVAGGGTMDDAHDLIGRLLAVAGMIMEDTAEAALLSKPGGILEARIGMVAKAGADIATVASAAAIIARRYADSQSSPERHDN